MSRVRELLRRIDIRLGLGLAAAIGLLLVVMMSVFFWIATHETAELLQEQLRSELSEAVAQLKRGEDPLATPSAEKDGVVLRRTDASGRVLSQQDDWPREGQAW